MKTVQLTHRTVKGIDLEWEEIVGFPFGSGRFIAWNPDHRCGDCGRGDFVVTRRPDFRDAEDDSGKPIFDENEERVKIRVDDIINIVCPRCIDFHKEDSIVADFDHESMTVVVYDHPRWPTEDELRPGRWRKDRAKIVEDYAPKARVKTIGGADFLEWQAYMREAEKYRREYEAAQRKHEEEKERVKRRKDAKYKSKLTGMFK